MDNDGELLTTMSSEHTHTHIYSNENKMWDGRLLKFSTAQPDRTGADGAFAQI